MADLPAGTRFGPYEITGPLGAGGMGEVYKSLDTRLQRSVAIKVLPASLRDDPDKRARFEREAHAVAALNHPHICTIHDAGHQNAVDFLVMEYLEGSTLAEEGAHLWPEMLPDGNVLFTIWTVGNFDDARLAVLSRRTGDKKIVLHAGFLGRYASGRLVFGHGNRLFAVPFDLERQEVTGTPMPLVDGVAGDSGAGTALFAVSQKRNPRVRSRGAAANAAFVGLGGTERTCPAGDRGGTRVQFGANISGWSADRHDGGGKHDGRVDLRPGARHAHATDLRRR